MVEELVEEDVVRTGAGGVVVRVGAVAVDQREVESGDVRLGGPQLCVGEPRRAPERGAEGVDEEALGRS